MVILYTIYNGSFVSIENLPKKEDGTFSEKIYVNMTNRCPCSCTFCLRQTKKMTESNSLWLKEEPSVERVIEEFEKYNFSQVPEVIFCGFGEPLERAEDVMKVASYLKKKRSDLAIRINTNGLENLAHGKDITPAMEGLIDTVSISLNASSAEDYLAITRNKFGIESFEGMKDFARKAKQHVPRVIMTVVDVISKDEIERCRRICEELGVEYRVRVYEE